MSPSSTCHVSGNVSTGNDERHTFVGFSLLPQFPSSLDRSFAPILLEIVVGHDFTTHEFVLKVGATPMLDSLSYQEKTTHWMTPAAWGALVPLRMVQARTSSGPQVKYRISYTQW